MGFFKTCYYFSEGEVLKIGDNYFQEMSFHSLNEKFDPSKTQSLECANSAFRPHIRPPEAGRTNPPLWGHFLRQEGYSNIFAMSVQGNLLNSYSSSKTKILYAGPKNLKGIYESSLINFHG